MSLRIGDLGSGYSGLKFRADLQPDYVKIDLHFVRDIDRGSVKRECVRSICNIGRTLHCNIIAEAKKYAEQQSGDAIYLSPQRHLSRHWRSGVQVSA